MEIMTNELPCILPPHPVIWMSFVIYSILVRRSMLLTDLEVWASLFLLHLLIFSPFQRNLAPNFDLAFRIPTPHCCLSWTRCRCQLARYFWRKSLSFSFPNCSRFGDVCVQRRSLKFGYFVIFFCISEIIDSLSLLFL